MRISDWSSDVCSSDLPVVHRADITQQLDWEVELAVVIGTAASRVARDDGLKHVFGYTVCIDMSARDCGRAGQWIYYKGQASYDPTGPCIVTEDELSDPPMLGLWLAGNGVEHQRSNTRHRRFWVEDLITYRNKGKREK